MTTPRETLGQKVAQAIVDTATGQRVEDVVDLSQIRVTFAGVLTSLDVLLSSLDKALYDPANNPTGIMGAGAGKAAIIENFKLVSEGFNQIAGKAVAHDAAGSLNTMTEVKVHDLMAILAASNAAVRALQEFLSPFSGTMDDEERKKVGVAPPPPPPVDTRPQGAEYDIWRDYDILGLFVEHTTLEVEPEQKKYFKKVLKEKLEEEFSENGEFSEDKFVQLAVANGETDVQGKERFQNFKELCTQFNFLIELGVFKGSAINTIEGTAKHEAILKAASIPITMEANHSFNENPLVGSVNLSLDEAITEDMGIVQQMVFAAFQQMKMNKPDEEKGREDGIDGCSKFSRAEGYQGTSMLDELINKRVAEMTEIPLAEPDVVPDPAAPNGWRKVYQTSASKGSLERKGAGPGYPAVDVSNINIKAELAKFPPKAIEIIKFIAKHKLCRDDLGTWAGLYRLGREADATSFHDGDSEAIVNGGFGGIRYQVDKKDKRDNYLRLTAFVNIELLIFMNDYPGESEKIWNEFNNKTPQNVQERLDSMRDLNGWRRTYEKGKMPPKMRLLQRSRHLLRELETRFPQLVENNIDMGEYTPEEWWQEFPPLMVFFNQGEDKGSTNNYIMSRDAMKNALGIAVGMLSEELPKGSAHALFQEFTKAVSQVIAFCGPPTEDGDGKYDHVHEYLLAAFKFTLGMYLMKFLPARRKLIVSDADRVRTPFTVDRDREYNAEYKLAVDLFRSLLSNVHPWYREQMNEFLSQNFKEPQHYADVFNRNELENNQVTWVLGHVEEFLDSTRANQRDHYRNRRGLSILDATTNEWSSTKE